MVRNKPKIFNGRDYQKAFTTIANTNHKCLLKTKNLIHTTLLKEKRGKKTTKTNKTQTVHITGRCLGDGGHTL